MLTGQRTVMSNANEFLITLGCCGECILIFLNLKCMSDTDVISNNLKNDKDSADVLSCRTMNSCNDDAQERKRLKESVCVTCLGLFQEGLSDVTLHKLGNTLLSSGYDARQFAINLSLPVSVSIRVHSVWTLLSSKFPELSVKHSSDHLSMMKDSWRNVMGPRLSEATQLDFITGQNINFCLNIMTTYCNDNEDCTILELLSKEKFKERRKQHKKFNEGVYTRQSVIDTFNNIDVQHFITTCPNFPNEPLHSLEFNQLSCHHSSIYFAGRYNKYSRELPQTPWLVEGERRMNSSVQELICSTLDTCIKSDNSKFSSSGREDVDVRCLGDGRPFVIEFVNPHTVHFTVDQVQELQHQINKDTSLIAVHDLQIVSKNEIGNLKEGEVEKNKSYAALCLVKEGYTIDTLSKLDGLKDIELQQMTPLRVLHRRPLSVRPRFIYTIKANYIDENYFKLYVTTQAGTYIKEFVHGDFGRTVPNLRQLLGVEVDIVALDVENVKLDWPPKLR